MKTLTDQMKDEIVEYFTSKDRWDARYAMGQDEVRCHITETDTEVSVRVAKMYSDGIGQLASLTNIQWLANLLDTEKIDIGDRDYQSGCESCDYGSEESLTLTCHK
jgi:hypothetical protein